jgi:hypothetical protein
MPIMTPFASLRVTFLLHNPPYLFPFLLAMARSTIRSISLG